MVIEMREHLLELYPNDITFNRRHNKPINSKYSFMRDAYYTPPRDTPSNLPSFMFGYPPVYDQGVSQIASTTSIA
jgi:hypothetical protein